MDGFKEYPLTNDKGSYILILVEAFFKMCNNIWNRLLHENIFFRGFFVETYPFEMGCFMKPSILRAFHKTCPKFIAWLSMYCTTVWHVFATMQLAKPFPLSHSLMWELMKLDKQIFNLEMSFLEHFDLISTNLILTDKPFWPKLNVCIQEIGKIGMQIQKLMLGCLKQLRSIKIWNKWIYKNRKHFNQLLGEQSKEHFNASSGKLPTW